MIAKAIGFKSDGASTYFFWICLLVRASDRSGRKGNEKTACWCSDHSPAQIPDGSQTHEGGKERGREPSCGPALSH